MTLSDFLLARIAEDEATLPRRPGLDTPSQARLWRECEAKRLILAMHRPDAFDGCAECEKPWRAVNRGGVGLEHGCPTVQAIALPYADHPDYREEWRP